MEGGAELVRFGHVSPTLAIPGGVSGNEPAVFGTRNNSCFLSSPTVIICNSAMSWFKLCRFEHLSISVLISTILSAIAFSLLNESKDDEEAASDPVFGIAGGGSFGAGGRSFSSLHDEKAFGDRFPGASGSLTGDGDGLNPASRRVSTSVRALVS